MLTVMKAFRRERAVFKALDEFLISHSYSQDLLKS
jgi:hypothetical protein